MMEATESITGGNGGAPTPTGGVLHIDVFLYVLSHIRVYSFDIRTYFRGWGHSLRSIRRSVQALVRAGYIMRDGRTYVVSESRVAPVSGKGVVVIPPSRPDIPDLDLLTLVMAGERKPMSRFLLLWRGAPNPRGLYRRSLDKLLEHEYLEKHGHRYYPGPAVLNYIHRLSTFRAVYIL